MKKQKKQNIKRPVLCKENQTKKTGLNGNTYAFTLVELIVVITILAILGTIAFIALQGYSTSARDSTRISDLSSMKSTVELFQLDTGKYPTPTEYINITYSGGLVWKQGIFGETVFRNTSKLNKIPLDPLSERNYTYSTTINNYQYQIGGILEGNDISFLKLDNITNAGDTLARAYITGNYNGKLLKSFSGTTCNMLAIPSIITVDTEINDLQEIINNNYFVYTGYNNLPSSFKGSKYKQNGGFNFKPNKLIVYNDESNCEGIFFKSDYIPRLKMLKGLQEAYSGTILGDRNLNSLVINEDIPTNYIINYAGNFVNNNLGGNVYIGNNKIVLNNTINTSTGTTTNTGSLFTCTTQPNIDYANFNAGYPTENNQAWQNIDSGLPCYYSCNNGTGWNGSNCILATECTTGLSDITLTNGQIWSCKNLGASTVGLTSTSYGNYYQWGKNTAGWANSYVSQGKNAWGQVSDTPEGTNRAARKGPCQSGRHVPSKAEWQSACFAITGSYCTNDGVTILNLFKNTLKLPPAGNIQYYNGIFDRRGTIGFYRTSDQYSTNHSNDILLSGDTSRIFSGHYSNKAGGFSVRCIKN